MFRGKKRKTCNLIVFGLDRLVNLYSILNTIKNGTADNIPSLSIQELYLLSPEETAKHKGLIDSFLNTPSNATDILEEIKNQLKDIKNITLSNKFLKENFEKLRNFSSLTECAYATNIITRDLRKYFIRQQYKIYKQFAQHILDHPDFHIKLLHEAIKEGSKETSTNNISLDTTLDLPFFKNYFALKPRTRERVLHDDLITEKYFKNFLSKLNISSSESKPFLLLKKNMFIRAVGGDLAKNVEELAQPVDYIYTIAGSISERLTRINTIIDYLQNYHPQIINNIDVNRLKQETRYLALDWRYFSTKIYPALEGTLGAIALEQQGYHTSLINLVSSFHTANKSKVKEIKDPTILFLIFIGILDEAVSIYKFCLEDRKEINTHDTFAIRRKLITAIESAMSLGLKEEEIIMILGEINSLTPVVKNKDISYISRYISRRIKNFYKN